MVIKLKDLLKEIIDEKMSYYNDDMNEKISDYLPGQFNSAAAQAKRQGLRSIGFGRWVNKDNKIVAKSVDGKLQAVSLIDPDDPSQGRGTERTPKKDNNPRTKPLDPSRNPDGPQALSSRKRALKRKIVAKVVDRAGKRLETPEAQEALKTGRHLTGAELKKILGITPQIYRMVSFRNTSSPYPMRDFHLGPNPVASDTESDYGNARLEYYPKTKTYRLRHFFKRSDPKRGGDYDGNDPYYGNPSRENEKKFKAKYKNHPLQMHGPIDDPLY